MDKTTRNVIQKATQEARRLIEQEYAEQLEGTFDILPDGKIAAQPGAHLDPTERLLREKIVAAIQHEQAKGISPAEAVKSYLREAAFTTLNRFVALKLLEARGLVQECISKGEQSSGFKEFCGLAPGLVALPDHGYRLYIESLFDEIGREVRILFDRRAPASLLWPRRQALFDLLGVLNTTDLAEVWGEDETIGWVYQYFNSDDERRQMRSESQAPRNSRELAVRNQFFTPRYVVEFLTDNTLGRIWYEMRQGMTELKNQCKYLVRRKDEVFLSWECRKNESKGAPGCTGAGLLLSGMEESFPPFDDSEESINRLIQMAQCVNGYARHPFEDEVDAKWWPFWVKEEIEVGKPLADFSTQDLLDTLFGLVRADRHSSPYSTLLEEPSTISIANEIRRRVIESRREDLSQEELLRQPVLVPFRKIKDPRDLKILDPACGSGHFLLYAFDLLETIYIEGWHDEQGPESEITGHSLQEDYNTQEDLQLAIPELIIRWNLHGIDIDQRAVQIAATALWLRAQRSWQKLAIKGAARPPIAKSNIVTAEPMPSEEEMRREFVRSLTPRLLGQLVEVVFNKMKLAGMAGSLLKIEEEIKDAVAEARRQWMEAPKPEQLLLYPERAPREPKQLEMRFDTKSITDERFWEQAEECILDALQEYAKRSENGRTARRRLFAEDAARGFAFIDLCRKHYDIVLMNPPFGEFVEKTNQYVGSKYPDTFIDFFACFVERGGLLSENGSVGAITPRAFLLTKTLERWRLGRIIPEIRILMDMGFGVLDGSTVETCAYVLEQSHPGLTSFVFDLRRCAGGYQAELEKLLTDDTNCRKKRIVQATLFSSLPRARFLYHLDSRFLEYLRRGRRFDPHGGTAKNGLQTYGDERFLRLSWEIEPFEFGKGKKWVLICKGGDYETFFFPVHLVMNYENDGKECGAVNIADNGQIAQTRRNFEYYYKEALAYPSKSTRGFSVRQLHRGCLFALKGPVIVANDVGHLAYLLGWANSTLIRGLVTSQASTGEYLVGIIQALPWKEPSKFQSKEVAIAAVEILKMKRHIYASIENDAFFTTFDIQPCNFDSISNIADHASNIIHKYEEKIRRNTQVIDIIISDVYSCREVEPQLWELGDNDHLIQIGDELRRRDFWVEYLVSYTIGCAYGRWDVRIAIDPSLAPQLTELFDPLPICPPGMLVGSDGLPAKPNRIVSEEWLRARPDANTLPQEGSGRNPTIIDSEYPLHISWDGILVDEPGFDGAQPHREDIVRRLREVLHVLWKDKASEIEQEGCNILGISELREYFRKPTGFFQDHIKRYSKSRRKAPIYWQLATPSCNYAVWLYYHRFTKDTFYQVLNDYVKPKLQEEERRLTNLRQDSGPNPTASQRKEIAAQESFVEELRNFRDEVARIAPLWKPDLNDGVIINFAPLWRLVPQHRQWQKESKSCWDKPVKGDYDWAHLAMHLWPERVVPKCAQDRSLAIAHGLEEQLWYESEDGKWRPKEVAQEELDALIEERTSPTVKAALNSLLSAAPNGGARSRGRSTARRRTA